MHVTHRFLRECITITGGNRFEESGSKLLERNPSSPSSVPTTIISSMVRLLHLGCSWTWHLFGKENGSIASELSFLRRHSQELDLRKPLAHSNLSGDTNIIVKKSAQAWEMSTPCSWPTGAKYLAQSLILSGFYFGSYPPWGKYPWCKESNPGSIFKDSGNNTIFTWRLFKLSQWGNSAPCPSIKEGPFAQPVADSPPLRLLVKN
jgi:hypothetical protein